MHGQLDRRPAPSAVRCVGGYELRFLAVPEGDGTPHRKAPYDSLARSAVENRIGICKLDGPLALSMIEYGYRFVPRVSVVTRDGSHDVAHVLLPIDHCSERNNQISLSGALDDEGLPDPPCIGVLCDAPDCPHVSDIALVLGSLR